MTLMLCHGVMVMGRLGLAYTLIKLPYVMIILFVDQNVLNRMFPLTSPTYFHKLVLDSTSLLQNRMPWMLVSLLGTRCRMIYSRTGPQHMTESTQHIV